MIQTYQGYFKEDGRFVPDSLLVKIPVRRRAIVNILEDEMPDASEANRSKTVRQRKKAAIKKILADASAAEKGGLADADWNELSNLRSQTNTGMSRVVDL